VDSQAVELLDFWGFSKKYLRSLLLNLISNLPGDSVRSEICLSLDFKIFSGKGSKRKTKNRVLREALILQRELHRKKTRTSDVGFSNNGLRAS
jgi:hypothetical protein